MKKIATAQGAKQFPGLQGAVAVMIGTDYPSSLSEWRLIPKVLPPENRRVRKRVDRRWIIDAVLYVCRTGCQWRYLPKDVPHWHTVYGVFRQWKLDGIWLRIHEVLRDAVRKAAGKNVSPTAGIIDSQSTRTAEGGESRGFVGGKKITGRKRHILVDTLGMLLMVVVHGADVQDYEGGATVLESIRDLDRRLKTVFADGAYGKAGLPSHAKNEERIQLQTVLRPAHAKGFQILPKRWIVERTFAWITRRRRLCKDYERLAVTSETMVYIAMIDLMSRRLANQSLTGKSIVNPISKQVLRMSIELCHLLEEFGEGWDLAPWNLDRDANRKLGLDACRLLLSGLNSHESGLRLGLVEFTFSVIEG